MTDVDDANRLIVALVEQQLVQFRMGYGLHLELGTDYEVTIETRLSVSGKETSWTGQPLQARTAGAMLPLISRRLSGLRVDSDGSLILAFGRSVLTVLPHPSYEAWQIRGPQGLLIVSTPGGDVAIWRPET